MLIAAVAALCCAVQAQAEDAGIENLRKTGKAFASVARSVSPAVVYVEVEKEVTVGSGMRMPFGGRGNPFGNDFFDRFFGSPGPSPDEQEQQPKRRITGHGSGFVISEEGHILTNNHVVAGADEVSVTSSEGDTFPAKVVGNDPQSDVAVISIEGGKLPALSLGDSSKLEVGEWVVALGNPFGLQRTLTVGVVSAKGRTTLGINDYEDFIQTDAAINPGNSGGPLVNLNGEVIGMNTAIFSRSGGYMGIGFAIPIDLAESISDQLIEHGSVTRGYLGIVIQPLSKDLASSFGLEDDEGILVAQVAEDSPAERAGLQQGDVIIEYAGKNVTELGQFRNRVAMTSPGSKRTLTILRNGDRQTLKVKIGKLPDPSQEAADDQQEDATQLGFAVQTLTEEIAQQFDLDVDEGVIVTRVKPGSIAAEKGIKAGAIILEVDREPVANAAEFNRRIKKTRKDGQVLLLVQQGDYPRYVVLKWE